MTSRAPTRNNPALPRNASTSLDPAGSHITASNSTSTSVRRNLFPQAGAARRQLRHGAASSSTSTTAHASASSGDAPSASNDIITRDPLNGTFTIDAPQVPITQDNTLEEENAEAQRRMIEGWRKLGDGMVDQSGELRTISLLDRNRLASEHAAVVAMWIKWDWNVRILDVADAKGMDAEIRAVLMASLEEKATSLEEDGWMFGDEERDEE